jgi:phenylacetate-CoA ligase
LARGELEALQDARLARLGERLARNEFYRDRIAAVGGRLDRERIRDIEPTTKEDFLADQDAAPPYGLRLGVEPSQVAMVHTTAGTSGHGKEMHALTWEDVETAGYLSSVAFQWAGLRYAEPAVFHVGMSNSSGGNAMLRGIQAIGNTPVMVGQGGFGERLELMHQFGPVGMYCTPSALNGLTRSAEDEGYDLAADFPALRFVLVSAEPYPIDWTRRMEEAWGVRVFEDYGATQSASSICAATCAGGAVIDGHRGTMHLFEWAFLFEIVDETSLEPVAPGEYGELLITSLVKRASPVLRFKTRDRVRFVGAEPCGVCGRSMISLECGTITRYDDLLKIKGNNVWPVDMESLVLAERAVREFAGSVVIGESGRDELILSISVGESADRDFESRLVASFKARFNITPKIELVAIEALPQWFSPERKARRFRDERLVGLSGTKRP